MSTRPRLSTRIPFWGLIAGSLASAGAGAYLLVDRLGVMTATLTDGTATGVEVYVGQSLAVVGAVLVGAGVMGLLLAFAIAALASLRPAADTAEQPVTADEIDDVDGSPASEHGYERGLDYTSQFETVVADDETEKQPAPTR